MMTHVPASRVQTVQDPQAILSEARPQQFPYTKDLEIPAPWKKFIEAKISETLLKRTCAKVWSEETATIIAHDLWEFIGEAVLEFDNQINWGVDTVMEAHYLDKLYDADMRREDAERKLDGIRQAILRATIESLSDTGTPE